MHEVIIKLTLSALMVDNAPEVRFLIDNEFHSSCFLNNDPRTIEFRLFLTAGTHVLKMCFLNKEYLNYSDGDDMAVLVNKLQFQHLTDDFKIFSRYQPIYPEPWATNTVKSQGYELDNEIYSEYLGWNGTWYIEFETPIYHWIHKTLNLGWNI